MQRGQRVGAHELASVAPQPHGWHCMHTITLPPVYMPHTRQCGRASVRHKCTASSTHAAGGDERVGERLEADRAGEVRNPHGLEAFLAQRPL